MTDLAEFVSDYWQMFLDGTIERPSAKMIANAYIEQENIPATRANVKQYTAQVAYYLP